MRLFAACRSIGGVFWKADGMADFDRQPADVNQRLIEQYTEIARLVGGLAHESRTRSPRSGSTWSCWPKTFRPMNRRAHPPGAGQNRDRAARVPAAARPTRRFPQLCQGAAAQAGAGRPERPGAAGTGVLPADRQRSEYRVAARTSVPTCLAYSWSVSRFAAPCST